MVSCSTEFSEKGSYRVLHETLSEKETPSVLGFQTQRETEPLRTLFFFSFKTTHLHLTGFVHQNKFFKGSRVLERG